MFPYHQTATDIRVVFSDIFFTFIFQIHTSESHWFVLWNLLSSDQYYPFWLLWVKCLFLPLCSPFITVENKARGVHIVKYIFLRIIMQQTNKTYQTCKISSLHTCTCMQHIFGRIFAFIAYLKLTLMKSNCFNSTAFPVHFGENWDQIWQF